jgi:hypothetical protein
MQFPCHLLFKSSSHQNVFHTLPPHIMGILLFNSPPPNCSQFPDSFYLVLMWCDFKLNTLQCFLTPHFLSAVLFTILLSVNTQKRNGIKEKLLSTYIYSTNYKILIRAPSSEKKSYMLMYQLERCGVLQYSTKWSHCIMLQDIEILSKTLWYMKWLVKEATEICLHPHNMKRKDGFKLSQAWNSIKGHRPT